MKKQVVFKDFGEFLHYIRPLTQNQIDIIFHSLPSNQQKNIEHSYISGGWEDLVQRNKIDKIIDEIESDPELGFNLLSIRQKVLSGKSVYLSKRHWEHVNKILENYDANHINYILGGIETEDIDDNSILLVPVHNNKR